MHNLMWPRVTIPARHAPRFLVLLLSAFYCAVSWVKAAEPTVGELTELFLPARLTKARLSPQGDHIAFLSRQGDVSSLGVYDLKNRKMNFLDGQKGVETFRVWWIGPSRLLAGTKSIERRAAGFVALDADGKNIVDMWKITGETQTIYDALPESPGYLIVADRQGIYKLNLRTFDHEPFNVKAERFGNWVIDAKGQPRAAFRTLGYDERGEMLQLWRRQTGQWERLTTPIKEKRFFPQFVADDDTSLIGWEYGPESDFLLARQDLTTGGIETLKTLPAGLEPTNILYLKDSRRPIAAAYEQGAVVKLVAFSEAMAPSVERLQKQFAGYTVQLIDAMPDEKTWLVWIGNSRLPGAYVLFNHETSQSLFLTLTHEPTLTEDRLAPADYFTFPQRNGGKLSARVWRPQGIKNPPLVVYCPQKLPADIVEDSYQADAQALVRQGFAVLQVNGRNSWAYGVAGRKIGEENWIGTLQEDLEDAVAFLAQKNVIDASRVALFGVDLGGVLALQVANRSSKFSAITTLNVPLKVHRSDLDYFSSEIGSRPLISKLGGWWASERFARDISPGLVVAELSMPALYLHDEDSIKNRPNQQGREIRSAVKNAKVPAQTGLAFTWSHERKPPSRWARENAEISMKIAAFLREKMPAAPRQ